MKLFRNLVVLAILCLFVIGGVAYWFADSEPVPMPEPPVEVPQDPWQSLMYVSPVDWPPQTQFVSESFSCTNAGEETARAGKTEHRVINDKAYCITRVTEGAAGSVYTQYAYATETEPGEVMILTFAVRMPQCGNYGEPEQTNCEAEQTAFDPDRLVVDWQSGDLQ